MSKIFLLAVFLCTGFFNLLFAQELQVTGVVKSKSTGGGLAGATVQVKGSKSAATTDADGNFTVKIPKAGTVIVVSYVGMKTIERKVDNNSPLTIELVEGEGNQLTEVVVVGYGTQKVTKVSGAISTIKAADIEKLKPVRAEEALQGRASGVTVIQNGSPGSKPTINVRGIPSYTGGAPLLVVDGIPQTTTDLNSINPSDIESISVLKDAATTAIYGVSGGNGVILITTKTGRKSQNTEININGNYGIQQVINTIGVLNATEYASIINEGSTVSGGPVIFNDLSKLGKGTNWQNEIFKDAAFQSQNITARGGSDIITYFLGGGYLSQGGIVGGTDKSYFNRYNLTANLVFDISSKLKLILNTSASVLDSKGIQENSFNSVVGSAINFDPTVSVLNSNPNTVGKYGFSNLLLSEIFNPLTKLDNTYNKNIGNKLYGKFEFQYQVLKDVKLTSRFGYTKYDGNSKTFTPLVFYGINNVDNSMNADGSTVTGKNNSVAHEKTSNFNYTWETFANYNFKIKDVHNFETVVGFSLAKVSGNAVGATRQDVPFNSWDFADFTAATGSNTATNPNGLAGYYYQYFNKNISYFGRANYDYNEKYLASFSMRSDGSSVFGENNKFAKFYAGSLGWVVSKESFFNSKLIDFLKIRGSYGSVGNDKTSVASFVQIVTGGPSYNSTANSNGYTFGDVFYPGSTVGSAANKSLAWEKQIQSNIGFDITFNKRKLSLTADYFQKNVSGLLFKPSTSLYLGTVQIPDANIGTTKSNGMELTLGYNETIGRDFKLNTSLTYTTAVNKVTATNTEGNARILGGYYFNGQSQSVTVFEKGFTPGYFYGFKTDGLFQTTKDVLDAPTQSGAQPGDIKFVDVNGDGKITDADKTKIGDPFPNFTLGWNVNLEYKNLDLNVFTYVSHGNDVFRAYERNANFTNKDRSVLGRWTGPGTTNDANNPRYSFTDANSNIRVSDRYVEDGSFIKIKNIQLGYTFSKAAIKNVFSRLRVYAQVKNAFLFTKYTGFDPEIAGGILDSGIDRGAYPQARTFAFGVDIKL